MRRRTRRILSLLGPAFVAAVAYVDPGNFAANFSAGSQYGYVLLWVLVVANSMASLVQFLSAKVGLVTGMSLPEVVASKLGRKSRIAYWAQAEIVAIATDLAEIIGGAIGLNLLFGIPMIWGAVITALVSLVLLAMYTRRGQKTFERVIVGLLLIIPIGFIAGLVLRPPDVPMAIAGLIPQLKSGDMLLLASAMLGATVMPHVVYLHSALARDRHGKKHAHELSQLLKATKIDVGLAMVVAGSVNIAMLLLAASALHGVAGTDTLQGIFSALYDNVSPVIAFLFGVSLLIAGLASTAVGSHAGVVILDGLLKRKIPLLARRLATIIPAIAIIALGIDPTAALITSQVALSFGIPLALIPLLLIVGSRTIMGEQKSGRGVLCALSCITVLVIGINVGLVWLTVVH